MIKKYRKKTVIVEAVQLTKDNLEEVFKFVGIKNIELSKTINDKGITIKTLEGNHLANWGDCIIKGIKGEFYPCKPDIFEKAVAKSLYDNRYKILKDLIGQCPGYTHKNL